jgi:Ca2+-binding RTX toxin-like protein
MSGGLGNDVLTMAQGGTGLLVGGPGEDRFNIISRPDAELGNVTILDFTPGEDTLYFHFVDPVSGEPLDPG